MSSPSSLLIAECNEFLRALGSLRRPWKWLQQRHVLYHCLWKIYRCPFTEREVESAGLTHSPGIQLFLD